jgi:hypothetical protein
MTSFEAGFIKCAFEHGLSEQQAVHALKRAAEYPGSEHLFKQLPEEHEQPEQSPGDLDVLSNLLKEELMHGQMSAAKQKINL